MVGESEIINAIIVEVDFRPPSIASQTPPCYLDTYALVIKCLAWKICSRVLIVYLIPALW